MRLLYFLLILSFTANAQHIVVLDSISHQPIPSVLITDSSGKIISITNDKGEAHLSQQGTMKLSHISYKEKVFLAGEKIPQEIFLSARYYNIPEVIVTPNTNKDDYKVISSYIRMIQYTDSIPIYFTEGIVDFYISKKGKDLKYKINALRVYENSYQLQESKINKGAVDMSYNGLFNFLAIKHFPLSQEYLTQVDSSKISRKNILLEGGVAGYIDQKEAYTHCFLDLLYPKKQQENKFMGRTTVIKSQNIFQQFANIEEKSLKRDDFITYRYFSQIDTKTKKTPWVSLINVFEIYVLDTDNISKKELKQRKTEDFFGNFEISKNPDAIEFTNIFEQGIVPELPSDIKTMIEQGRLSLRR